MYLTCQIWVGVETKNDKISQEIRRQRTEEIKDIKKERCEKEFHGDGEGKSQLTKLSVN